MPTIGRLSCVDRTEEEELSVYWRIPKFCSLSQSLGDSFISPKLRVNKERWYLRLYPNYKREAGKPASGWVELALCRYDDGPPSTRKITVAIRGTNGVENRKEEEREFSSYKDYLWRHFYARSDLMKHKTTLLPRGNFTIKCVINRPSTARSFIPHSSSQVAPTNRSQSSDMRVCEKLHEDFSKLLASGEKSDVIVQVGDVEFKVHSVILFARSPALSVSLQHESEERASNRIVIEDCESDVFRDFLQYLYTGSIQPLTEKNIFGLHRIADKYLADDLKQQCLKHIQATLCVQTFCDTIKLALTHGENDLLQQAIDFASKNIHFIVISIEWQNFICEYPRQANEILIKSFSRCVPKVVTSEILNPHDE